MDLAALEHRNLEQEINEYMSSHGDEVMKDIYFQIRQKSPNYSDVFDEYVEECVRDELTKRICFALNANYDDVAIVLNR